MSAVDRVMRAYAEKYTLNAAQAALVRREISEFIGVLLLAPSPAPTMSHEEPNLIEESARNVRMATRPA